MSWARAVNVLLLPRWAGRAVTQISVHRPRFLKSGPGLTSKTANQGHEMARLTFSPRLLLAQASLRMACPFVPGGWWWWGQPQASLRMACLSCRRGGGGGVSPRRRCAWRVLSCRAGGGGGVSPRRRCAWRVLSCRAGGGGGGVSPRRRCAWRVLSCRAGGGGGGVSPRRRCAWRVLSCRAGWWWWGQPQASLRMACPFVPGGWRWGQPQASLRQASSLCSNFLRLHEARGSGTRVINVRYVGNIAVPDDFIR